MLPFYRSWGGWGLSILLARDVVRATGPKDEFTGYAAVEERVQQQRLQSARYNLPRSKEDLEELSIMGWGKSLPSRLCRGTKSAKHVMLDRWRLDTGQWFAVQLDLEWPTFISNGYMEMANYQLWCVYP